jgi:hypothetical protein
MSDTCHMARLQLLMVVSLWLLLTVRIIRGRLRSRPDRRLLAALETLRGWQAPTGGPSA